MTIIGDSGSLERGVDLEKTMGIEFAGKFIMINSVGNREMMNVFAIFVARAIIALDLLLATNQEHVILVELDLDFFRLELMHVQIQMEFVASDDRLGKLMKMTARPEIAHMRNSRKTILAWINDGKSKRIRHFEEFEMKFKVKTKKKNLRSKGEGEKGEKSEKNLLW